MRRRAWWKGATWLTGPELERRRRPLLDARVLWRTPHGAIDARSVVVGRTSAGKTNLHAQLAIKGRPYNPPVPSAARLPASYTGATGGRAAPAK